MLFSLTYRQISLFAGLDAQAAWSVVRFLRKLADAGQAILCTIHQPSGSLFSQFDRLCLLKKGGETVYFGDIGENSKTVINYFEGQGGRKCGDDENVAEYVLGEYSREGQESVAPPSPTPLLILFLSL